jgi:4-hydroxy-tetrahydrodipicolinate synthase
VVTPPYVRPTQAGLLAHYRAVADEGGLPVVLYNVPGRTGCDLLPGDRGELPCTPNIVGIKEARADAARMEALLPCGATASPCSAATTPPRCGRCWPAPTA